MQKLTKLSWLSFFLLFFSLPTLSMAEEKEPIAIPYPVIDYSKVSDPELVKKGEYLTKAGDCIACHTDTSKENPPPFAGGLGIKTPFGTFYTNNITPDPETGIGKWSDRDFIKAMHDGLSPHNANYFPVFPYLYFNRVSDEDLIAIKAYLNAIPPVKYTPPKNDVPFPFNVRLAQWGWKILFFLPDAGYYQYNPKHTAQWNRGAYLVDGLEHCSMCHTPINPLGAPKKKYYLTGGIVDNYPAPNITSSRLKDFSVDQIVDVFLKDQMLGGGKVQGPMLDVNRNSLHYLSREDLEAIAVYLKTVVSKTPPKPKLKAGASLGEGIYQSYCATCHASGAAGAPIVGDQKAWTARIALGLPSLYQNAIKGINGMPAKGTCSSCSDADIEAAVQYMVDSSKEGGAPAGGGYMKAPSPMPTYTINLKNGEKVYKQVCSICHDAGQLAAPKLGDKAAWASIIQKNMDILFEHTIKGYKAMPPKGACVACSTSDLMDATVYMVQESKENGDYTLW